MRKEKDVQFYLKRMAALQFPGCKDNYSTKNPMHILQEKSSQTMQISIDDVAGYLESEEELSFYANGEFYNSLEELVLNEGNLPLSYDSTPEEIDAFNCSQMAAGKIPFMSWKEIRDAGGVVPNFEEIVDMDCITDYLMLYEAETEIMCFRYSDDYENKAICFTHVGCTEAKKAMDNHIFRPVRTYAWNDGNSEFCAIMQFLQEQGQELLEEESRQLYGTHLSQVFVNAETRDEMATYIEQLGQPESERLLLYEGFVEDADGLVADFDVSLTEFTRAYGNWFWKSVVTFSFMDGTAIEMPYPFEADGLCEKGKSEKGTMALWNYFRYTHEEMI